MQGCGSKQCEAGPAHVPVSLAKRQGSASYEGPVGATMHLATQIRPRAWRWRGNPGAQTACSDRHFRLLRCCRYHGVRTSFPAPLSPPRHPLEPDVPPVRTHAVQVRSCLCQTRWAGAATQVTLTTKFLFVVVLGDEYMRVCVQGARAPGRNRAQLCVRASLC